MLKIKRAVMSVSDKTGIVDFAKYLDSLGVEIISTGGTGKLLSESGIAITPIKKITGNDKDDYFDGRMKTISFNYESALLYLRDNPNHVKQAGELGIPQIDLVVCNLYPFENVVRDADVSIEKAIENIDIGGPCMVRAAAKNSAGVAIVVDPGRYKDIMAEMEKNDGAVSRELRQKLMVEAFERTADYDAAIHTFFSGAFEMGNVKRLKYVAGEQLGRYAENWHQKGWLYRALNYNEPNIPNCKQVHGGPLGYNNIIDAEAALASALEIEGRIAVSIIKHSNPCGYATGATLSEAFERGWQGDPVSAFGSVIATTVDFDLEAAKFIENRFVEVIIAPSIKPDALKFIQDLGKKKAGLRLLEYGAIPRGEKQKTNLRFVQGGLLEQERDELFYLTKTADELVAKPTTAECPNSGKKLTVGVVTENQPAQNRAGLYDFALRHLKHVKSNAIVIAREYADGKYQILGMGCGQPNRKDSVALAGQRAHANLKLEYFAQSFPNESGRDDYLAEMGVSNADAYRTYIEAETRYVDGEMAGEHIVLASDAFFPFRDGLDNAAQTGVKYVLEPGGSVRDDDVIAAANEHGIALIFTGVRKFNH